MMINVSINAIEPIQMFYYLLDKKEKDRKDMRVKMWRKHKYLENDLLAGFLLMYLLSEIFTTQNFRGNFKNVASEKEDKISD